MVKKIGNLLLLFFLISLIELGAQSLVDVQLHITHTDGNAIQRVQVGTPFNLKVILYGNAHQISNIRLDGINDFTLENQGTTHQSTVVNGVATTKITYQFLLTPTKVGDFTIGPVDIEVDGTSYTSNVYKLSVIEQAPESVPDKDKPLFLLEADKNNVVVGEPISLSMKFYPKKHANLLQIEPPVFTDIDGLEIDKKPISGSDINGVFAQWHITCKPKKEGKLVIPAARAFYHIKKDQQLGSIFQAFSNILQFSHMQDECYSNAVVIDVNPLPDFHKPVHGVGDFMDMSISINQTQAKVGEGIVLRLALLGKHVTSISHPPLNLPEGLTWYDSKEIMDTKDHKKYRTKTFEYIVQAKEEGTFEITAQEFTYFDIISRTYKTLKTKPITLHIQQGVIQSENKKEHHEVENESSRMPIINMYSSYQSKETTLPRSLFLLLFLIPFFAVGSLYSRNVVGFLKRRYMPRYISKQAFVHAEKMIQQSEKDNDSAKLYDIFTQLFADRLGIEVEVVDGKIIQGALQQYGIKAKEMDQWQHFYIMLQAQKFSSTLAHEKTIYKQAKTWVSFLKTYL